MLTVGRFVTVLPYSSISDESLAEYTWPEVLAVCEVAVVGVLQNISADGKCFNLAPGYVKAAADAKKVNASRNFQDTQVPTVFPTASKAGRAESMENVPVDGLGDEAEARHGIIV